MRKTMDFELPILIKIDIIAKNIFNLSIFGENDLSSLFL